MIRGGNGLIAEKMAQELPGKIHLNHSLQIIEKKSDGTYLLTFKNGNHTHADLLILTMPCPVYKNVSISDNVIPTEKRLKIEGIQNGTTEKILVPILPNAIKGGSHTNGHIVTFPNDDECLLNMYYLGHQSNFTQATIEDAFKKELPFVRQFYQVGSSAAPILARDQSFGSYNGPVGHSWMNDPYAMGSYSYVGVRQESLLTSVTEFKGEKVKSLFAPIENSLFFAGEHASVLLDVGGTIEGAVESGERTARMIQRVCHET
jgi:monoamine oxidase